MGRDHELALLERFFRTTAQSARTLVLEGAAGAGKTTLWRSGLDFAARSQRVLSVRPVEAEAKLGYGALADMVEPVVDEVLPVLPAPQRKALEVALLRAEPEGPPLDQRALGTALVSSIRALVLDRPLVLAIDDVQWLDASSAEVLVFACRRLEHERVSVFLARRVNGDRGAAVEVSVGDVTRLPVPPLDRGTFGRLLTVRLHGPPSRRTIERLFGASGGNPFFALELAAALERRGGDVASEEPLPIPLTLREAVSERLFLLGPPERDVLLAVALLADPTQDVVGGALGVDVSGPLAAAYATGVIELDGREVRFAHPLYASVVVADASSAERQRMHALLADVVDEPEQRSRHMALATTEPDEHVAQLVEQTAMRALTRGAPIASADLLEQAARLSASDAERGRRLAEAARSLFVAGDPRRGDPLIREALALLPSGQARAEALTVDAAGSMHDVPRLLAVIEETLATAGASPALRAQALAMRSLALSVLRLEPKAGLQDALRAVEDANESGIAPLQAIAQSARAWSEVLLGMELTPIRDERILTAQRPFFRADRPHLARLVWRGELDAARGPLLRLREQGFEHGDEESAMSMTVHLLELELRSGDWATAKRYVDELMTYTRFVPTVAGAGDCYAAWLAAYRGDLAEASTHSDRGVVVSERFGHELFALLNRFPVGMALLAASRPREAALVLEPLFEILVDRSLNDPGQFPFVPDLVEALVGDGRLEPAERALAWLEQRAHAQHHPWASAATARCHGVVSAAHGRLDEAIAALSSSHDDLDRLRLPFELARTRLVHGGVLRRARRRQAARTELTAAAASFERLGAHLWAGRARAELDRLGGRPHAGKALTAAERRVAELAAAGRSNKEIASELFVTENTVETHLKHVYGKLGVRSRIALARRLEAD